MARRTSTRSDSRAYGSLGEEGDARDGKQQENQEFDDRCC